MEAFIGQLQAFGFSFAPRGWARCDGQTLPVAQNQALFSLIGTIYGGDGRTTFALPDLRGRCALHYGQGPETNYPIGARGGAESVALTNEQLAAHKHTMFVNNGAGDTASPAGKVLATDSKTSNDYGALPESPSDTLDADSISNTGGGQPHENRSPFLAVNWCIKLDGIFPSRN